MKTIRRIYLYVVFIISLEVITWALIQLGRTLFSGSFIGSRVSQLAGSLAFLLVGLPVFLLHWWLAQRDAAKDEEEHFSHTRATFLYAVSLALWIPAVQNLLAILQRALALLLNIGSNTITLGKSQTWSDNLVAIVVNVLFALYIHSVLQKDWQTAPKGESYSEMRRTWRYLWSLYGLGFAFAGVQQLISYLFSFGDTVGSASGYTLVNGISYILVGGALWYSWWSFIDKSLNHISENGSIIRLIVLYLVSFLSVVTTLIAGGAMLNKILYALFQGQELHKFYISVGDPLAWAVPAAIVWAFYSRVLRRQLEALPDAPRQAALRRLYAYVLSFLGLLATFIGLVTLADLLVEMAFGKLNLMSLLLKNQLSGSLSAILVGVPVWLRNWSPMNSEAVTMDEAGDHARRSIIRKTYLYLILFAGVMGVMFSTGSILYNLISTLLGDKPMDFALDTSKTSVILLLFAILLLYHWRALRADGARATTMLSKQHAKYSVVVFDHGEGDFAPYIVTAINADMPQMPVAVHPLTEPLHESLVSANAAILPASLAANPPEALHIWLREYSGERLVVPDDQPGWVWVGLAEAGRETLAKHAAKLVGQLAEGRDVTTLRVRSPWAVLGYIFIGLIAISMLCTLVQAIAEAF